MRTVVSDGFSWSPCSVRHDRASAIFDQVNPVRYRIYLDTCSLWQRRFRLKMGFLLVREASRRSLPITIASAMSAV